MREVQSGFARGASLVLVAGLTWVRPPAPARADTLQPLDLARFGQITSWDDAKRAEGTAWRTLAEVPEHTRRVGVVWAEERDVSEVRLRLAGEADIGEVKLQYWARTWPPAPPAMPTIEDPQDDHWRGQWLTARVEHASSDGAHVWTFAPLAPEENGLADHLPGLTYRRTLKLRLELPAEGPRVESLEIHSGSVLKPLTARIELGVGEEAGQYEASLEIDNGFIQAVREVREQGTLKALIADLLASEPSLPGSFDITVVTVQQKALVASRAEVRTFSFSTRDLQAGPIHVPDFKTRVTLGPGATHDGPAAPPRGRKIREQIPLEPEQTAERANREIPPLDPWLRQRGDKVYLPVAADSSWQKFAVEYGGDVLMDRKRKIKAKEQQRLHWEGDLLRFRIGTGTVPYYREDRQAKVAVAEDCLPIVINRWQNEGLAYEQEAFATLLTGPLDPTDPGRSEQTPAILMMQLRVHNPGSEAKPARVWLSTEPNEPLEVAGRRVYVQADTHRLRASLLPPAGNGLAVRDGKVLTEFEVSAGGTQILLVSIPFVSDLQDQDAAMMEALDYAGQRDRVATYWRDMIERTVRFSTPEPQFNHLARFVVPHIHISTTKDPLSGLYMVPAASYSYQVYANESCFQTLLLDALGDTERSRHYLRTLAELQGSRSFPGNYVKPHDGVYHGAKVNDEYDYTASDYGLDHGTVLWALAKHYFYTRDAAWLKGNVPGMLKAIEWTQRQRALTRKRNASGKTPPEWGLLPAGHLEDNGDWGYWFSVNAYCVAGMQETAAALEDIGHPEAQRVRDQAEAYRQELRAAVQQATERAPVAQMRDGTYSPYVPTRAGQRFRGFGPLRVQFYSRYGQPDVLPCYRLSATREVLYGAMILLNLKVFNPNEPIAEWILDDWEDNLTLSSAGGFNVHGFTDDAYWFSQGGLVFQPNLQNPALVYLHRREIPAAIRTMYNGFFSCLYPEVHTLTEEYREWKHASGPFYKSPDEARFVNRLRDALVLEVGDELWLAVGTPRRWLASGPGVRVDRLNSYFGPLGYSLAAGEEARTVVARIDPPTRNLPRRIWLHARLPESAPIKAVQVNGQHWTRFDPATERIELPVGQGPLDVSIRY